MPPAYFILPFLLFRKRMTLSFFYKVELDEAHLKDNESAQADPLPLSR